MKLRKRARYTVIDFRIKDFLTTLFIYIGHVIVATGDIYIREFLNQDRILGKRTGVILAGRPTNGGIFYFPRLNMDTKKYPGRLGT